MKIFIFTFFLSLGLYAATDELYYKIHQVNDKEVQVTLNYSPQNAVDYLYVPESVKLLSHEKTEKHLKVEGDSVEVTYSIRGSRNWMCGNGVEPRIEKDFFHLEGESLLVHPRRNKNECLNIHIEWDKDKQIANSFGIGQNTQSFKAVLLDLKRSIFLGVNRQILESSSSSNISMHSEFIGDKEVVFLSFTKKKNIEQMQNAFKKILERQRSMYDQKDFDQYLVAVFDDRGRGGGRAFVNASCVYYSPNCSMDLPWIFSHEHFHNFNGIRVHTQNTREDLTWFIEGFTEFYANRTNYHAGVYDKATYDKNIKKTFREYHSSKARKYTYKQVVERKNTKTFYKRFLYLKGHLFAHYLDNEIKNFSGSKNSLDDFMSELYQTCYPDENSLTLKKLEAIYSKYDDKKLSRHILEFMHSPTLLINEEDVLTS